MSNLEIENSYETIPNAKPSENSTGLELKVKSTNIEASFTLFKLFFGMGVLVLPSAFAQVGLGLAIIGIIIIGLVNYYCLRLIIDVADDLDDNEIQLYEIGRRVLGNWGLYFIQISLFLLQISICIAILIFCHTLLQDIMCSYNIGMLCQSTLFYVLFSLAIALPLSFITNLHYLSTPSMFADIFTIFGLGSLLYYESAYLHANQIPSQQLDSRFEEFRFTQMPLFFGVAVCSYEGIGGIFNVRASMQTPKDFPNLLSVGFVILTILYIVISTLSYLTFGQNINGIVFLNLPQTNLAYLTIEIVYAGGLLCSYPIQIFPAFNVLENTEFGKWFLKNENNTNNTEDCWYDVKRMLMRSVIVFLMFIVAYTTKSFALYMNLIGSLIFVLISFVIPIIIYNQHFKEKISTGLLTLNYVILLISVVLGAFGVVASVQDLYQQ